MSRIVQALRKICVAAAVFLPVSQAPLTSARATEAAFGVPGKAGIEELCQFRQRIVSSSDTPSGPRALKAQPAAMCTAADNICRRDEAEVHEGGRNYSVAVSCGLPDQQAKMQFQNVDFSLR